MRPWEAEDDEAGLKGLTPDSPFHLNLSRPSCAL